MYTCLHNWALNNILNSFEGKDFQIFIYKSP